MTKSFGKKSVLLKVAALALLILLVLAVQTADADAASYEAIRVSDLKEAGTEDYKTKLKCGGLIWVGDDFNGADHHDVYYQKEEGGDVYLILDYFDIGGREFGYSDVLITNGQKFYYAEINHGDGFSEPYYCIRELDLGNGRRTLAEQTGRTYGYGYVDDLTISGYYNGNLYYSLSGCVNSGDAGRLYKVNVKSGKTTRVYKNFSAFPATGNGRYIYGCTTDTENRETDKFVIYDCKQGKKVRTIDKPVYYAEVMNGKLYFYEEFNYETGKISVYQASLSGKDRKRILRAADVGDLFNNRLYYGMEKEDRTLQYYRYNLKTGKKIKVDPQDYKMHLNVEIAEFGYK